MHSSVLLNPVPARQLRSRRPALILAAAFCGGFVSFGSLLVFTFGIFLKPLTAEFGWSRAQVSLAFTVAALTVAACSPYTGRLLDRYPARNIVLPCMLIYGVAFGSLSLLTAHLWHLLAVFVVLGIVGNGTTQLGYARVISAWFDRSRGRALSAVMAGVGLGSIVFPTFAQALISAYGWRIAYAVLGITILLLGIPLTAAFLYEPQDRAVQAQTTASDLTQRSARSCLRNSAFLCLTGALVLFSVATNGVIGHLSPLLTDRGFPVQLAAATLAALGFASLSSRLLTGYLMDRFFAARAVAFMFGLCAAGILIVLLTRQTWTAYAGALMIGAGLGAESDAVPFLLSRYFGLRSFSELYGYTWSAYAVAGALGPLLMGRFFDRTHSYETVLLAFFGMVLAAALLFAKLPRYKSPTATSQLLQH
ncbi:MAG: MFS transporter [Bryobacteraceae bacterium]